MNNYYDILDGASFHTLNLASAAWLLYSQSHDLVSSRGFFLGPTTNNIVEYHVVIGLLTEASSCDDDYMVVFLDSKLVVSHLNHVYANHNPVLLHLFKRVCILEWSFEFITYQHVPIYSNSIAN